MSKEVAVPSAGVPELRPTPAIEYDSADLLVQRVYVGNSLSGAVQDGRAALGDLFVADDAHDESSVVLSTYQKDGSMEPVRVHCLNLVKGWSLKVGNEFMVWKFHEEHDPDARQTYTFMLAIPAYDPDMPFKMTFSKSGEKVARKMITMMGRNADRKPNYAIAFDLTTKAYDVPNGTGKYWAPQVTTVLEPDDADVDAARILAEFVGASGDTVATASQPSI